MATMGPNPFELGAAIGGNVGGAIQGASENLAIDSILKQAQASGNPQNVRNAMSSILRNVSPEKQPMAMQLLQNRVAEFQQNQLEQAYQKMGLSSGLSTAPPNVVAAAIKAKGMAGGAGATDLLQKAFARTEELVKGGYTGPTIKAGSENARRARAELNNLSEVFISHLIPLINPRGTMSKERFNYIKSLAPRGYDTDATIQGKLASLRTIFSMPKDQVSTLETMSKEDLDNFLKENQMQNNISDQQLDAALQQAGGDIDAALKMLTGK